MSLRNSRDPRWWHDAIVYEIYVQSFQDSNGDGIGDLNGIRSRLEYLENLGITCIWLTPIMKSAFIDCGYDCEDYYDINPDFGTMEEFDALLFEAHNRGIRIILDLVLTYSASTHPWFQKALRDEASREHDYYIWKKTDNKLPPNNWFSSASAGPAWTYAPEVSAWYYHAFLPSQPMLNWTNQNLVAAMHKIIQFWLEKGVDGFRLDAINYMKACNDFRNNPGEMFNQKHLCDKNPVGVFNRIREIRSLVETYSDRMLVGEVFPGTTKDIFPYHGIDGEGLHLVFNLSFDKIVQNSRWYDGETVFASLSQGKKGYEVGFVKLFRGLIREYEDVYSALEIWPTAVLGNHDQPRLLSMYKDLVDPRYKDRMAHLIAGFLLLTKGTTFIYYGDEIGMENMHFKFISDLKDNFGIEYYKRALAQGITPNEAFAEVQAWRSRDKARTPMQWNTEKNAGFSEANKTWLPVNDNYSETNVSSQVNDYASIFHAYQSMISIKKEHVALRAGHTVWIDNDSEYYLAFDRVSDTERLGVVINYYDGDDMHFPIPGGQESTISLVYSNAGRTNLELKNGGILLNPVEVLVYSYKAAPHHQ